MLKQRAGFKRERGADERSSSWSSQMHRELLERTTAPSVTSDLLTIPVMILLRGARLCCQQMYLANGEESPFLCTDWQQTGENAERFCNSNDQTVIQGWNYMRTNQQWIKLEQARTLKWIVGHWQVIVFMRFSSNHIPCFLKIMINYKLDRKFLPDEGYVSKKPLGVPSHTRRGLTVEWLQ